MAIPTKTSLDYIQSGDSVSAATEEETLLSVDDNLTKLFTAVGSFEKEDHTYSGVPFVGLPLVNDYAFLSGKVSIAGTATVDLSGGFAEVVSVQVTGTTAGTHVAGDFTGTSVTVTVEGGATVDVNITIIGLKITT